MRRAGTPWAPGQLGEAWILLKAIQAMNWPLCVDSRILETNLMASMTHEFTDIHTHGAARVTTRQRSPCLPLPLELLGACGAMHTLRRLVSAFAPYDVPLLIVGEAGTGTRRIAEFVHRRSERRDGPFMVVDAATLSGERLPLELFGCGHGRCDCWLPGVKDMGQGGTVLLAHAECLPTWGLRRLVWALDRRRTGFEEPDAEPLNVRVIATLTGGADWHKHEEPCRQVLLDRLSGGMPLLVPPLRERGGDIVLLARQYLAQANRELGKEVRGFTAAALAALETYPWPGNLQELSDRVRSAVLAASHLIGLRQLAFLGQRSRRLHPADHLADGGADDA